MSKWKDVLTIINGRNQKKVENPSGKYPIYGSGGVIGYADEFICPANTIVIGRKGNINKPICVQEPFWNVDTAFGLVPNSNLLNYKYLFYFCINYNFNKLNTTVTIPSLTKANLLNIEIKIPPLEVQHKIASILDTVSEALKLRKQQLSELDLLVKSKFIEMFGDPETNTKNFPIVSLSQIAIYYNGLTYKPEDVEKTGTIVLRSSNIQNSQLDFTDIVRVTCSIQEKLYVKENDILMCSRNGSAKLVGKVALIKHIEEAMSFGAFMMIIRSEYYMYLMTYFQMEAFRRQIKTGATTTINQITGKMLNQIELPIPPKTELNKFISFVEHVNELKSEVQKSIEQLQTLFDSLMQEYFE